MPFESPGAYWDTQSQVGGPVPAILASLPVDEVAAVRAAVDDMIEQFRSGDVYAVPSSLVVVDAR